MPETEGVRRIDYLARHKPIPAGHRDDRRSVYWVDKEPVGPPTVMATTPRLEVLSQSRHLSQDYQWNRDREFYLANGPFYNMIKPTSKNVPEATPRVAALSAHKGVHKEYTWDRLLPIRAALPQEATPRIADLARSKTEIRQSKGGQEEQFYDFLPQPVSSSAQKASASARLEALSDHKKYHHLFRTQRDVQWEIDPQTLKVNASLRVCQLARPRSRTMIRDDNWDPYQVSKAAKFAQITPRIEELSECLPRKQRPSVKK